MTRFRLLSLSVLPFVAAFTLLPDTQTLAQQPPQKIDVSKLKQSVDDVVIPVPSEIFNALHNIGGDSLNWAGQVAPVVHPHLVKQEDIAMLLGTVIANGFIAVQAKEADQVQAIGRQVIELATALGVKNAVLSHCNAISDASKLGDWSGVRSELDKAQSSVRDAMKSLNSRDQSELVSIAGWLRGTQTLSALVGQDYKPERAELLHQSDMLNTFENQFKGMSPKVQASRKVTELREGLQKIKPLVEQTTGADIPQKSVEQINQITNGLVKSIDQDTK